MAPRDEFHLAAHRPEPQEARKADPDARPHAGLSADTFRDVIGPPPTNRRSHDFFNGICQKLP